jgi:hypothetical protein
MVRNRIYLVRRPVLSHGSTNLYSKDFSMNLELDISILKIIETNKL